MTELLFLKDSYQKSCSSKVIRVDKERFVVLNQTVFYPQGGGQPFDLGIIAAGNERFNVLSVKKNGSDVVVEVDKAGLKEGLTVECHLDWIRRFALMRMHTSAHILAKVIWDQTGSLITGNQLDLQQTRLDFNVEEFDADIANSFVQKANSVVKQNLPVTIDFLPREEAINRPELVRLKDIMPPNLAVWRIISIGEYDVQADGGTHVANTSEIGELELIRVENKGKENRRIYWKLRGN
ncbi:MAG: alanyl-tRNA editing protein [Candidatus Micrarchaeota archaeon]